MAPQAEGEEQVGSLELKQLKLMRDQISTTLREIAELRDDFIALARRQSAVEKGLADSDSRHSHHIDELRGTERVASSKLDDLTRSVQKILAPRLPEGCSSGRDDLPLSARELHDRCDGLNALLGKAGEAQSEDMRAVNSSLHRQAKEIDSLNDFRKEIGSAKGRMALVEQRLTDLSDTQERDVAELKTALESNETALQRIATDLAKTSGNVGRIIKELQESKEERDRSDGKDQLEYAINEMVVGHEAQLRALRMDLDQQASELLSARGAKPMVQEASEKQSKDVQALQDAISKLAAAPGRYDPDFREFRSLFSVHAKFGDRLLRLEEIVGDENFHSLLPDRLRVLEKRLAEVGQRPAPAAAGGAASPAREGSPPPGRVLRAMPSVGHSPGGHSPVVVRKSTSPSVPRARSPIVVRQGAGPDELECWKAIHSLTAPYVQAVNERRNIMYDLRTRRAFLQQQLSFKRRVFSAAQADDPTAEWGDEDGTRPMFEDIAFLYRNFVAVAIERYRESQVTVAVVRTRVRNIRVNPGQSSRTSLPARTGAGSASFSTAGSYKDRAQQWEAQLAQNRAMLVADTLVSTGVPKYCIEARVEFGAKDDYWVEFSVRVNGNAAAGSATFEFPRSG